MNIIIDTNLVHSDWKLKSEDFKAFVDFVERTNSKIYIPKIVWEETRLNYQKDIEERHKSYEKAGKLFGGSLVDIPDLKVVKLDYKVEADKYLNWLLNKFRIDVDSILPFGEYTERIAKRALNKRKPFNRVNNNEYKDTLVWETVLDVISGKLGNTDNEVVLISNDGNAFEVDRIQKNAERSQKSERQVGVLHPHLQEDVEQVIGNGHNKFYFYESLSKFLSAHYTPIKGVDKDSVIKYLSSASSTFGEQLWSVFTNHRDILLNPVRQYNPLYKVTADFEQLTIDSISGIDDFFIFSKEKNKVSVSCSLSVYITLPISYSHFVGNTNYSIKHVLQVTFNVYFIDGKIDNSQIENVVVVLGNWLELPKPQWNNEIMAERFEFYQKAASAFFLLDESTDTFDIKFISYKDRHLASSSKYIPRKVGAEKKTRRKPKSP